MQLCITEEIAPQGYERLIFVEESESKLRAFICIHSTACGPAAGGCRMWNYDTLEEARYDALRLAEGMTYKNALAELGLGGGKAVIIGNPKTDKSEALFRAFGRAVDRLQGAYYTAEDVGISTADMEIVAQETPYAVGLDNCETSVGDPSPYTAEGVFQCLKLGAADVFGSDDLTGRKVLVQGLGHVGMSLASKLFDAGADLIVSDINVEAVELAVTKFDASVCAVDRVFDQEMDIFAPCALGGILTEQTVAKLSAKLVCGAANNQLAVPEVAAQLQQQNICYLPDYMVNAGGIISLAAEIHNFGREYQQERLDRISTRAETLLNLCGTTGKTPSRVAHEMAVQVIESAIERDTQQHVNTR